MTREQAEIEADIAYFEQCLMMPSDNNVITVKITKQICARVLKALNKQMPKKPKFVNGNIKVFCPTCGGPLKGDDFCGDCGQRIDWSDDEYNTRND